MRKPHRGRRPDATGRSRGTERHIQLPHFLLESAAWKSLKPVERALFIEVAQRYSGFNNGIIGLGVLEAGRELHVRKNTAGLAFRVLIERGFLAVTRHSTFGQKKLTREWRLTYKPMGPWDAPTSPPTNDFTRWRLSATRPKAEAQPVAKEKKPVSFGIPLSTFSDTAPPDSVTKTGSTGAQNDTKADSVSNVLGPPSIYHGFCAEPREPARTQAPHRRRPSLKGMAS